MHQIRGLPFKDAAILLINFAELLTVAECESRLPPETE